MRRISPGIVSLLVSAVAACPVLAQSASGVRLGRPQVDGTPAAPEIRLTAFADLGAPLNRAQPVQPATSERTAFAVLNQSEPPETPLPPPRPVPVAPVQSADDSSFACGCPCGGECGVCCDECGCWARWLLPWNWFHAVHCIPWDNCYVRGDYLAWWMRGSGTPALVSTGVLGAPGTAVLFGGSGALTQDAFSGGRFTVGWWCDCEHNRSWETTWFFLAQRSVRYGADTSGFPVLVRPFFSANTNAESGLVVAQPGTGGAVAIDAPSHLWGGELNWRCNLWRNGPCRWDLLAGLRALELTEAVNIGSFSEGALTGGNLVETLDHFSTVNQFYGSQVGLVWQWRDGRWSVEARGKVALGETYRSININGSTVTFAPGGAASSVPGGLLALGSNSGRFRDNRFSVVPEFGLNVGYQITDNWRLTVGYTFLYWSSVYRPGDQIDPVIDQSQLPGSTVGSAGQNRPKVLRKSSDFWVQGVNVGLEYRY